MRAHNREVWHTSELWNCESECIWNSESFNVFVWGKKVLVDLIIIPFIFLTIMNLNGPFAATVFFFGVVLKMPNIGWNIGRPLKRIIK